MKKNIIITNYKNLYKIDKDIKINEIINLDKQIQIAIGYINRLYNRKNNLDNLICSLTNDNNEKLVTYIKSNYNYKGKIINNNIS